jgi:Tfp pilus assembly protein PilF
MLRIVIAAGLAGVLWGCASAPVGELRSMFQPSKGYHAFKLGLQLFEDGSHVEAARSLQMALDMGLREGERTDAHKYLAFIHCASNREATCRDEFRRALVLEPALALAPAERGHPVWGPAFAGVKADVAKKTDAASSEGLKAEPLLQAALRQYEEGEYDESAKNLQVAIDQGLAAKERAKAHKHLAFIHCASNRERQCREEFRRALAVDPSLELAPAEAGHPVWGPLFRSVKAGR